MVSGCGGGGDGGGGGGGGRDTRNSSRRGGEGGRGRVEYRERWGGRHVIWRLATPRRVQNGAVPPCPAPAAITSRQPQPGRHRGGRAGRVAAPRPTSVGRKTNCRAALSPLELRLPHRTLITQTHAVPHSYTRSAHFYSHTATETLSHSHSHTYITVREPRAPSGRAPGPSVPCPSESRLWGGETDPLLVRSRPQQQRSSRYCPASHSAPPASVAPARRRPYRDSLSQDTPSKTKTGRPPITHT